MNKILPFVLIVVLLTIHVTEDIVVMSQTFTAPHIDIIDAVLSIIILIADFSAMAFLVNIIDGLI